MNRSTLPHRGLGAPQRLGLGGLVSPKLRRSEGAFTLIEIMIVVAIVTILSWLAMVAIARIKDKAARATIANNLRQLYQAKEFYYSETGDTQIISTFALDQKGYLRTGLGARLANPHSFEAGQHWHYYPVLFPGKSTVAYRGSAPPTVATVSENEIYYPGLPDDPVTYWNPPSAGSTAAPTVTRPPAQPAGPVVPAGLRAGTTPLAPWVPARANPVAVGQIRGRLSGVVSTSNMVSYLKVQSPDGSPVRVTGFRVEGATTTLRASSAQVTFDAAGTGRARAWVTVDNGHGQNEIEVFIQR